MEVTTTKNKTTENYFLPLIKKIKQLLLCHLLLFFCFSNVFTHHGILCTILGSWCGVLCDVTPCGSVAWFSNQLGFLPEKLSLKFLYIKQRYNKAYVNITPFSTLNPDIQVLCCMLQPAQLESACMGLFYCLQCSPYPFCKKLSNLLW